MLVASQIPAQCFAIETFQNWHRVEDESVPSRDSPSVVTPTLCLPRLFLAALRVADGSVGSVG